MKVKKGEWLNERVGETRDWMRQKCERGGRREKAKSTEVDVWGCRNGGAGLRVGRVAA